MILPEIRPDEYYEGYTGRLMHLNQHSKTQAFHKELAQFLSLDPNASQLALLAAAAGQDVTEFARKHTLQPITEFIVNGEDAGLAGVQPSARRHRQLSPRLCKQCVQEELAKSPFAYWHRAHLLQGADWCLKHDCGLTSFADKRIFERMPQWLLETMGQDDVPPEDLADWPVVKRFLEIQVGMLRLGGGLVCAHVKNLMAYMAQEKGFRVSYFGSLPLISDRALEVTPARWLRKHFPGLAGKHPGRHSGFDDNVRRGVHNSGAAIALALAILFNSSDEALTAIEDSVNGPERYPNPPRTVFPEKFWSSREFLETYAECRGRVRRIAVALDTNPTIVSRHLRRLGLTWRGDGFPDAEIRELLDSIFGRERPELVNSD